MAKEKTCEEVVAKKGMGSGGAFGGFYFLGFIGSAIFFIQHSVGFGAGVVAFLKAIVWPVFMVHRAWELMLK